MHAVAIAAGLAGMVLSVLHIFKDRKWAFAVSNLIAIALLMLDFASYLIYPNDMIYWSQFITPLERHLLLLAFGVLATNSNSIFWKTKVTRLTYFAVLSTTILFVEQLIQFLDVLLILSIVFPVIAAVLYTYHYLRRVGGNFIAERNRLIVESILICSLSFVINFFIEILIDASPVPGSQRISMLLSSAVLFLIVAIVEGLVFGGGTAFITLRMKNTEEKQSE